MKYPSNIRMVRIMCSGRIDERLIFKTFASGADGVLVAGCHPGDCHYLSGNYMGRRRFALLKDLLEYIGVEKERVQFSWVSASEGGKFTEVVREVVEEAKALGSAKRLVKKR